jgi:nitroreductase
LCNYSTDEGRDRFPQSRATRTPPNAQRAAAGKKLPVPADVVARVLDTARFAPSGGNRQGWRVVVVDDPAKRRALRDLYLPGWYEYLAMRAAGLTPWAPITDRAREAEAVAAARPMETGFAEHLDEVDRDGDRYQFAGGASVYPFAWSVLLAGRAEGLAGVITTMPIREEAKVKALFDAPEELAVAAVIAMGKPVKQPTRLTRAPVASFATVDSLSGPAIEAADPR